jgi:2-phosphoglycerate kinase
MAETIVFHRGHGLPYSKGLMAQSLSAIGLAPERAFELARIVERRLSDGDEEEIDTAGLSYLTEEVLGEAEGEAAVRRFRDWRRLDRLERPLVVLIGGTTGVGKSTLASMLAARLGVTRLIATDVIRQVLRAFFTHEAMPTVHSSAASRGTVSRPTTFAPAWRRSWSAPRTSRSPCSWRGFTSCPARSPATSAPAASSSRRSW